MHFKPFEQERIHLGRIEPGRLPKYAHVREHKYHLGQFLEPYRACVYARQTVPKTTNLFLRIAVSVGDDDDGDFGSVHGL